MAVAAAVLAALCISLIIFRLHNLQDSSRGEPVRAEEARVHAKENCHSRAGSSYYLYFHVPSRDIVVTCRSRRTSGTISPRGTGAPCAIRAGGSSPSPGTGS